MSFTLDPVSAKQITECVIAVRKRNHHSCLCMFSTRVLPQTWWRHKMETFSALLAICAGNSPVTAELPAQRPVTLSFDIFIVLRLNKRLSKQSWGWWFETPSLPSWRRCNGYALNLVALGRLWTFNKCSFLIHFGIANLSISYAIAEMIFAVYNSHMWHWLWQRDIVVMVCLCHWSASFV